MDRRILRRTALILALAAACGAGALTTGVAPVGASTTGTGLTHLEPVTWVDGQGRQYVLADQAFAFGPTPPSSYQLFVSRDRVDGEPDTTWGTGGTSKLLINPTPPTEGATLDRIAAATSSGVLTLIWDSAGCASTPTACGRWFHQIDATGATVAAPVFVDDLSSPFRALPDGSVLVGSGSGSIGWRGPDGASRGAPTVSADSVRSASVDAAGRLLLATADGMVRRWPAGGPVGLTFDSGCAGAGGIAVGPAPTAAGGVAVACGSVDQPVSVTRYDDAGSVSWTATDTAAPDSSSHLQTPRHATITADGRVWVAGGGRPPVNANFLIPSTVLASFGSTGPITRPYERATIRPGHYDNGITGINEIRPVDATHVAMVDLQRCCTTMAGALPESQVTSLVLPERPAPPDCNGPNPFIAAAGSSSITVLFPTCPAGAPSRAPTGYRVEVTSTAGKVTKSVTPEEAAEEEPVVVPGVPAGRLLSVAVVPYNAQGDTVGSPSTPARTVAPFRTVQSFTDRPYAEGRCELVGLAEGASQAALVDAGTLAPADHVAAILDRCEGEHRIEPVARLYEAAFLRPPDTGGLRYWVGRSRGGLQLRSIAAEFARSSEFTRRYGKLSNRKYVERIYQNVLGRPGDSSGIAFWTSRLDRGQETRGGILAQFSESAEHVRRTDPLIQPTAAWFLMLDRAPNAAERTQIAGFDQPRQDAALAILAMPAYADRVSA